MAWRTAELADSDLEWIAVTGIEQFGVRQSRNYIAKIVEMFDTLSANPLLGMERTSANGPVRLMPSGRHHILYVVEDEDVVILRIVHALQNWPDLI
ncbi:type II toxin-antitoxin system RelE/ParE family toxin [Devosia sp. XJ19-1]|uniref:Type II toxin-antitoxin system RelE/ParE family toxin n=1 Tax=Devosia ureilytica TaxID=2952754 RepID=A0A9Q4FTX7_9HYPH|nr:type II toxin-antitoxin system RelE/ParE family toxin [Devosia ureilytica]MCP8884530.1 type II toxin-antitoxin system RelE/ParE family toxin [Devosia ureilytica]MCP8888160.1 type II toxin-antitoxin system RelE/ParE family toxin [Devosia ureilytica]